MVNALFIKTAPATLPLAELLQRNATANIRLLFITTKYFATFCFFALIHTLELGKILELKVETRYRLNVDEVSVADKQACTYGERTACNTSVP